MGFHIEGRFEDNFVVNPKNFVENGDGIVNDFVNDFVENDETRETRAAILEIIRKNPKISAAKIAKDMGMTPRNVQIYIRVLKQMGLVERVGKTRGHWVVKPPNGRNNEHK